MNLKKYWILLIISIFLYSNIKAQKNIEIEFSTGVMIYDVFKEPENDISSYEGFGIQSSIDFWLRKSFSEKLTGKLGIGYSNFLHGIFVTSDDDLTSYLSIKLSSDYNFYKDRLSMLISFSNYILLHKEIQDKLYLRAQRRIFTNIDLGLLVRLNKKWTLGFYSPITIFPMFKSDENFGILGINGEILGVKAGTTGLRIGIIYKL